MFSYQHEHTDAATQGRQASKNPIRFGEALRVRARINPLRFIEPMRPVLQESGHSQPGAIQAFASRSRNMSRSRNIKPGFFKNEILVGLPFEFRLLFIGLWGLADRDGRMEDRPVRIKMEVFPADSVDVEAGLQALHSNGFIQRYAIDSGRFLQITAWVKHQNPHMKEAASTIPAPCEHSASTMPAPPFPERAGLIPDSLNLIPDSLNLIPDSKKKPVSSLKAVAGPVEIQTWIAGLGDHQAIPETDKIFDYAELAGISLDFLELSWKRFVDDMTERKTRKKDWRAHYRNAVRGNWFKLWWFDPATGDCKLTTTGEQARRAA